MHVSAVLVASARAMANALDELGFPEDDNRIVELDGRLGFITCSHESDSDDMFALIAELAARGETWEIQFRIDLSPTRAIFHTLARHQAVAATEEEVEPPAEEAAEAKPLPLHDLATPNGLASLRSAVGRIKAIEVFAEVGTGRDGRARARILQRNPRRPLAEATAEDEPALRARLREVMPNIMFSVSRARD